MFSIHHPFIDYSVAVLRSQTSEAGVAKTCMQLLKSNQINNLSCHEWVNWLDKTKSYLETAIKIDENVASLLKVELEFRKKDYHMPVITAYGKLGKDAIEVLPKFRLLSMNRIEWGLIRGKGREKHADWDDQEDLPAILQRKQAQIKGDVINDVGRPCIYAKRVLNVPRSDQQADVVTIKAADAIVQYLEKLHLIPWRTNQYDCHYLAHAAWQFVDALSIDPKYFFFATIGDRFNRSLSVPGPSLNGIKWRYHVALGVQIPQEGDYILDPWVNPEKALKLEEWTKILNSSPLLLHFESIETFDHTELCIRAETAFAIATAKRFAGLSDKITSVHTPLLKAIVEPFEQY